jgi:hypothetical protein
VSLLCDGSVPPDGKPGVHADHLASAGTGQALSADAASIAWRGSGICHVFDRPRGTPDTPADSADSGAGQSQGTESST